MTIRHNFDLSSRNTFGMKVSCACFVEYSSVEELKSLDFGSLPSPVLHIGGGSNLLFTGDFPGTILHSAIKYIKYIDMGGDDVPVAVGAGVCWDEFVASVSENGLWGAENLSLIPGEVGAAAVQNIGAYGVEVKDIVSGVTCYDTLDRTMRKFKISECGYGYRDSVFKRSAGRYVITGVLFRLRRTYSPSLEYKGLSDAVGGAGPFTPSRVRDAVIRIRQSKLPDPAVTGSAGSFFKNPVLSREQYSAFLTRLSSLGIPEAPHYDLPDASVKVPAAWLIEQCGFKGAVRGNAAVYDRQPLVLVNATGNASPEEITALGKEITDAVAGKFNITLSPEVQYV